MSEVMQAKVTFHLLRERKTDELVSEAMVTAIAEQIDALKDGGDGLDNEFRALKVMARKGAGGGQSLAYRKPGPTPSFEMTFVQTQHLRGLRDTQSGRRRAIEREASEGIDFPSFGMYHSGVLAWMTIKEGPTAARFMDYVMKRCGDTPPLRADQIARPNARADLKKLSKVTRMVVEFDSVTAETLATTSAHAWQLPQTILNEMGCAEVKLDLKDQKNGAQPRIMSALRERLNQLLQSTDETGVQLQTFRVEGFRSHGVSDTINVLKPVIEMSVHVPVATDASGESLVDQDAAWAALKEAAETFGERYGDAVPQRPTMTAS